MPFFSTLSPIFSAFYPVFSTLIAVFLCLFSRYSRFLIPKIPFLWRKYSERCIRQPQNLFTYFIFTIHRLYIQSIMNISTKFFEYMFNVLWIYNNCWKSILYINLFMNMVDLFFAYLWVGLTRLLRIHIYCWLGDIDFLYPTYTTFKKNSYLCQCLAQAALTRAKETTLWENKRKRLSDITLLVKIWTIFKVIGW